MFPNEIILEVFRWFDRKFLETKLRLVSRRADALIQLLAKHPPRLWAHDVTLSTGDNFIEFLIKFDVPLTSDVERLRRPFDIFNPSAFPSYLYFHNITIVPSTVQHTAEELAVPRVMMKSSFSMSFFASVPAGKDSLSTLLDYSWTNYVILFCKSIKFDIFLASRIFHSATFITATFINADIMEKLADWLATPKEPSYQKQWLPALKHCNVQSMHDRDSKKFIQVLSERFTNATCPSSYHVVLPCKQNGVQRDADVQPLRNSQSQEIFVEQIFDNFTNVWRQRIDSPFDKCIACGQKYLK